MATSVAQGSTTSQSAGLGPQTNGHDDPFTETGTTPLRQGPHRYSSRFDLDHSPFGAINSPTQVKKALEAHLVDTERRLQDTKVLGESLLAQQSTLQDKLRQVEEQQDEAEITPELRQQLKTIGQEHDDVSREIARSLLGPKSRAVSGEEQEGAESAVYTSQASGSPTKISAPSRRQRNQPTSRTADVQFAADISVSLLAQVRALQSAVAERDEVIKTANSDRLRLESDVHGLIQRGRTHDENEQRYKDENWNLETRNHELLAAAKDAGDREKRINASLVAALAEKARALSELDETKLAHGKLSEEHSTARKAHETELHSLKRDVDAAESERITLHSRVDDLTAQNQELARAMAGKYRNITPNPPGGDEDDQDAADRELGTPEQSPPPSPTKATPRHGGLESETLRSSLHHAHRQIQNLKSNIHREKTEKIELKRMLQDARDELDQQRSGLGGAAKKSKSRHEVFKKPARPDMLGNSRRTRTDIQDEDDAWEDQAYAISSTVAKPSMGPRSLTNMTDLSDAYQTAHETENDFETADERHTTESEAFETGAESMAGDSSDDLTETEDNVPRESQRRSLNDRAAGNRSSYYSTASTSAGEEEDEQLQTPVQAQPHRFRLRNGRAAATAAAVAAAGATAVTARQSQAAHEGTPDSLRTVQTVNDSPMTVTPGRSPPATEQSLFAELGGIDDGSSDTYGTPARSSVMGPTTPGSSYTPSKPSLAQAAPITKTRPAMVDSSVMTDAWQPEPAAASVSSLSGLLAPSSIEPSVFPRPPSPSDFPLPPSVPASPASPVRRLDHSTQYTPQRGPQDSPIRNVAFITPPKTTWDEAQEAESPQRGQHETPVPVIPKVAWAYSSLLSQQTLPMLPAPPPTAPQSLMEFSTIYSHHTAPIEPELLHRPTASGVSAAGDVVEKSEPSKSTGLLATGAAGGLLAGAAAALGLTSKPKEEQSDLSAVRNHPTGGLVETAASTMKSPSAISATGADSSSVMEPGADHTSSKLVHYSSNDQGAQTLLTSDQIAQALKPKPAASIAIPSPRQNTTPLRSPPLMTLPESENPFATLAAVPTPSTSRPGSASSQKGQGLTAQVHPPLPQDYKTNIARANSLVSAQPAPARDSIQSTSSVMGPPLLPASAMRRPHTPGESIRSVREAPPSRASQSSRVNRGTMNSQLSRRSSVSSFASELDERFNIRPDGNPATGQQYQGPATDPRMIQAITQTMIGEYLWKYTRKAGSKEMSSTRHRRYFWVHPYNKTLHWSVHDPQTTSGREARSKGVMIESVRVVTDDNPMPPGLHRKSLEITTPGRKIKLTATTGQRHETWFNALSYLLLRGDPADSAGAYATGGNEITRDDVDEFNVGGYRAHLAPNASRLSMSSYNSRTTSNTAYRTSRQAMPSNIVATSSGSRQPALQASAIEDTSASGSVEDGRHSRTDQPVDLDEDRNRTIRAKSMSRISKIFGSVTGRQSQSSVRPAEQPPANSHRRQESDTSIYNASVVSDSGKDSGEELRQEMLQQEAMGLGGVGLENVRACCDGE